MRGNNYDGEREEEFYAFSHGDTDGAPGMVLGKISSYTQLRIWVYFSLVFPMYTYVLHVCLSGNILNLV